MMKMEEEKRAREEKLEEMRTRQPAKRWTEMLDVKEGK